MGLRVLNGHGIVQPARHGREGGGKGGVRELSYRDALSSLHASALHLSTRAIRGRLRSHRRNVRAYRGRRSDVDQRHVINDFCRRLWRDTRRNYTSAKSSR